MDPFAAAAAVPAGTDSPPLRQTFLGFLPGRGRRHSNSHMTLAPASPHNESPPPQPPSPGGANANHRRNRPAGSMLPSQSGSALPPPPPTGGLSGMLALRRRRSAGALQAQQQQQAAAAPAAASEAPLPPVPQGPVHRIRLVPHLDSRRSLRFEAISRDVRGGDPPLRIGRFTDRSGMGLAAANALGSSKLAFKSKVVSRAHAEIWCDPTGRFMIKDTKSSSGTFLNHVRLSPANSESRQHELKDGDILQLGVDYQGGTEDIYKCVKIRVEVGREWQAQANAFNTNALKQLQALAVNPKDATSRVSKKVAKSVMPDCCICLFSVTIQQSLFIAPCSHAFHYKCIRPLLDTHYPAFSCPLCRTYADLEADVEVDNDVEEDAESGLEVPGLSRAQTRAAEDNAYPETDIEGPDTGASRLGARRRDNGSDGDADMADADGEGEPPLGVLSEDEELPPEDEEGELLHLEDGVEEHLMAIEQGSPGPSHRVGEHGEGSAGSSSEGVDADGTVGGKRKR